MAMLYVVPCGVRFTLLVHIRVWVVLYDDIGGYTFVIFILCGFSILLVAQTRGCRCHIS